MNSQASLLVLDKQLLKERKYWLERLSALKRPAVGLPQVEKPSTASADQVERIAFAIEPDTSGKLRQLTSNDPRLMHCLATAVTKILLYRYWGQSSVSVGVPPMRQQDGSVADQTLIILDELTPEMSFREVLLAVRDTLTEANSNSRYPFDRLLKDLHVGADVQVFDIAVCLESIHSPMPDVGQAVDMVWSDRKDHYHCELTFHPTRVAAASVEQFSRHFESVLEHCLATPDAPIARLSLLTDGERRQLLSACRASATSYPSDRCLSEWFESQVSNRAEAVAVVCGEERLTYAELNERANRLAHYLRELDIGPEHIVGICLERSNDMVVGILGILKAGGAYLPLDPEYPAERLTFMRSDSGAQVLVTRSEFVDHVDWGDAVTVCLDRDSAAIDSRSGDNPESVNSPHQAAYVIYTSGSTGRPKGCVVTHANVSRLFAATEPWFDFDSEDVWTCFHSFAFDFSVWELWGALLYGGRLVVVPYLVSRSPEAFRKLLADEHVTVLNQTPSAFQQLMEADASTSREDRPLALRAVVFGGEALLSAKLTDWFKRHGDQRPRLVNMYGITETTVHVTYRLLEAIDSTRPGAGSPIGVGIPDLEVYLLDSSLEPVPPGVPGEIYVGGAGISRGYLRRPGLTADRFIPHPFGHAGQRLYRTGDQAQRFSDGSLDFLGRIDQQVKIRGFRIELGEIETVLGQHPGLRETAVLARQDASDQTQLIAYVVPHTETPHVEQLRDYLHDSLPDYMVPSSFVSLDALPLTPNGKLDRRALPEAQETRPHMATAYVPPRDAVEEVLVGLVAEVLGIERVGVHDDFFVLGGDSLKGAVLINRLQDRLGEIVYVAALFERPTVATLAEYLKQHYRHRIRKLLGEEDAAEEQISGRRLNEADLTELRSLLPASRHPVTTDIEAKNPPAVFVLAPPRSGTTLLRVMLAAHPQMFAPPELELLGFDTLRQRREAFSGSRKFWLEGTIRAVMNVFACDAAEAEQRMATYEQQDLTVQQLYRVLQDALNGRLLVDKTPSYTLDVATLRRAEREFEGAYYIHLLRHPRGVIRSFEQAHLDQIFFPYEHSFEPRELAELVWTLSHENILSFLKDVPADRKYVLRFEDLLRDPEGQLERLCEFFKLPLDAAMLDPYGDTQTRMTDGPYRESRFLGDVKFREHGAINAAVADAWREEPSNYLLGPMTERIALQLDYEDLDHTRHSARIPHVDRSQPLPLSFAQERLWFLDQLVPRNPFYNMPGAVRLRGPLDVDAVRHTVQEIVNRHETLRTTFHRRDEGPVQVIATELSVDVPIHDLSEVPEDERAAAVKSQIIQEAQKPFDVSRGPVIRATLYRVGPDDHILFVCVHHIAADGWSLGVFRREVTALYGAFSAGLPSPLTPLTIQYADFVQWQRRWLAGEVFDTQMEYWRQQLKDIPALALPTDRPRPTFPTFRGDSVSAELSSETVVTLHELSRQQGMTLFMTLLTCFKALMAKYTGQEDIVIGSPIAGRTHRALEGLIGFFVNSLVLRTDLSGNPTFRELMHRVREVCHAAYEHQDLPFEKLVEELQPDRDLSRGEALIQVMFQLQSIAPPAVGATERLRVSAVDAGVTTTRFDMEVYAREYSGRLHVNFVYSTDIFERSTVERLAQHFERLITQLIDQPDQPLSRLSIVTDEEHQFVLWETNQDTWGQPYRGCIVERFDQQVERSPNAVALQFGDSKVTYAELNSRANQIAHALMSRGVCHETLVPVCLKQGVDFIVSVLAILKASGVYVPLDPSYPTERLRMLLADIAGPVLLTESAQRSALPISDEESVFLLDEERHWCDLPTTPPTYNSSGKSLAYLIFTSGSTGIPKAVSVTHEAIERLVSRPNYIAISGEHRVAQASTTTFDAATFEIWGALLNGAALVGIPKDVILSPDRLGKYLVDQRISTLFLTTALFNLLVQETPRSLAGLRELLFGGEAVNVERVRASLGAHRPQRLLHVYGPTETTTFATWHEVRSVDEEAVTVPIGQGISQTQAYVLDRHMNLVPINVHGELYIGGTGVARGYHNHPGLTAERFVPNPWSDEPGSRLYRTGDLVCWRPDGTLHFVGRIDHQVKVRGFRVELGEIETALKAHSAVEEVVVVLREDEASVQAEAGHRADRKRLVAYVVPDLESNDIVEQDAGAQVDHWLELYKGIYSDSTAEDPTFNLAGWQSSYDGNPIPGEEMRVWRDSHVEKLLALKPRHVLEIGCGTGLLLSKIAPHCESYHGTDFSQEALDYIAAALPEEQLRNVTLTCQEANDLGGLESGFYDLVILNSIVQYFPSIEYLQDVLKRAVQRLREGGILYIGDVRDHRLLAAFHADVQQVNSPESPSVSELSGIVRTRMEREKELLVDPAYFEQLSRELNLGPPRIVLQRGTAHNELTLFRYDVAMPVDSSADEQDIEWHSWTDGEWTLDGVREQLADRRPEMLAIANVPNARLGQAWHTSRLLADGSTPGTVAELRIKLSFLEEEWVEPEAFHALGEEFGFDVRILKASDPSAMHVLFARVGRIDNVAFPPVETIDQHKPLTQFSNHPLKKIRATDLIVPLRNHLAQRLPDYMVPAAFVFLDTLPLTASGKLNRRALPAPSGLRPNLASDYVAPRNETEKELATIWQEVIGVELVGMDDDFFALGGHSLMATQVMSRVRNQFSVDIPLRELFQEPTIAQLARLIEEARTGGFLRQLPPISPVDRSRPLPLSFAQTRLWFLDQLIPDNPFYNMPGALRLRGPLDLDAVRKAFTELVRRHETLRTTFHVERDEPVQIVADSVDVEMPLHDVTELPDAEREDFVRNQIVAECRRPFDLSKDFMIRAALYRLGPQEHVLFFNMHHIASDGWSHGILRREVTMLYSAFSAGLPSPLHDLEVQYGDYSVWQRKWLTGEIYDRQLSYWREQLEDLPFLSLPLDRPRPAVQTFRGDKVTAEFSSEICGSLKTLGQREGATLYMTLLAGFQVLLAKYTGQEDIVVGSPIAGRTHKELEGLIGFFVNTLVMRTDVRGNPSFREVLGRVREICQEAYTYQDLPFEKLVEELQPQRDLSREALVQVMFALQNAPMPETTLSEELSVSSVEAPTGATRFDLEIHVWEQSSRLFLTFFYSTDIFNADTIERLVGHYERVLYELAAHPDRPIADVSLVTSYERYHLLEDFSRGRVSQPAMGHLHEIFETQVSKSPDAVAVVSGETEFTFDEINVRANALAHTLLSYGLRPESLVAICVDPSVDTVVGLIGILKAGAAYVPIDPDYPAERLAYMLEHSKPRILVTRRSLLQRLPTPDCQVLCLDDASSGIDQACHDNPAIDIPPEALAYVIYTSGSTGKPKGVAISRKAMLNFLLSMSEEPGLRGGDTLAAVTALSFDISVLELFLPLVVGARLVVADRQTASDGQELRRTLEETATTVMQATPTTWRILLEAGWQPDDLKILVGGEALDRELARRLAIRDGNLWNMYGPTETTVWSSICRMAPDFKTVSIGKPVANTQLHVLDARLNLVPVGVYGELYIGGDGLARGYLNRSDLTAEQFVPNPFAESDRLYRTGDLARWMPDGNLEFSGRIDHQVKIRGFRIELGEIEATLTRHEAVRQAVVVARGATADQQELVAYAVPEPDSHIPSSDGPEAQQAVEQWSRLWGGTYSDTRAEDPTFNIVGWQSSYTGDAIPEEEMRIWRDTRVDQLLALKPSRVLEIGCGTGLLLLQIAPHCEAYHGTDISQEALDYLETTLDDQQRATVRLTCRPADDFSELEPASYDVVILNSVIQYFPSIDYLDSVLQGAIKVLRPGGTLFVGDVRDLRLLEAFHADVQTFRSPDRRSMTELRQTVRARQAQEKELLVHPSYFESCSERLGLGRPQLTLHRGQYRNEMSVFRYDVLLPVDRCQVESSAEVQWKSWSEEGLSLEALQEWLSSDQRELLGLTHVPNARVRTALRTVHWLDQEDGPQTVAELRRLLEAETEVAVDPEALWALGSALGYETRIEADADPGAVRVLFARGEHVGTDVTFPPLAPSPQPLNACANHPLQRTLGSGLLGPLRTHLKEHLPEYMVPGAIVFLDAMPLTPNGKLDRKALPAPDGARPDLAGVYIAPRNTTEETVAAIWLELLGLDRVGMHDNFFELGGHSLMATQVMSRVREKLNVDVPLRELFEEPTVAKLAQMVELRRQRGSVNELPPLVPVDRSRPIPLSFGQERLWFLEQLVPNNPVYNSPAALRLRGPLNLSAVQRAFTELIRRHETLRTTFHTVDDQPVQVIADEIDSHIPVFDLAELAEADRECEIRRRVAGEAKVPFDLSTGPLIRARLYRVGADDHILFLAMHHIISDGWSHGVLRREVTMLYSAFSAGLPSPLDDLEVQFGDYSVWQRKWLTGEIYDRQLSYWRKQLEDLPTLSLPLDRHRPAFQTFRGDRVTAEFSSELCGSLKTLGRQEGATLYMTLLAGFQVLLAKHTGQEDIVVGSPIAGRTHRELEGLIGFFVNTLVMRTDVSGNPSFREVLGRVRDVCQEAYTHQDLPFEKLVEELQPERDLSRGALVQVTFALQNAPVPETKLSEDLNVSPVEAPTGATRFDLEIHVWEQTGRLFLTSFYNTALFHADTIERLVGHYERLLCELADHPDSPIATLSLLSERERKQVLVEWNDTRAELPADTCIHTPFEEQVRKSPTAVAVIQDEKAWTYAELNARANQLARQLRRLGVGPGTLVGVCLGRSFEVVVALVGVLKAGGAYVPLDPEYPAERLGFMLQDSRADLLLTSPDLEGGFPEYPGTVLPLNTEDPLFPDRSEENLTPIATPADPAYVIYTSGSTGRPKGAAVSHRSVVNHLAWMRRQWPLKPEDRVLQRTAFSFDASGWEFYLPLWTGSALVLAPGSAAEQLERMAEILERNQITVFHSVPTLLQALVDNGTLGPGSSLKHVFSGGEPLTKELLSSLCSAGLQVHNLYGPTEATMNATAAIDVDPHAPPIPIGPPISNVRAYVLDPRMRVVPPGVPGELYLAGVGLALGYLRQAELTAERFVPNPFDDGGARLYRTGDLTRWLPNGELEFLGRIDTQVKLRGYRIELGEIEATLASHEGVRKAVVMAHGGDAYRKELVAYVVPETESPAPSDDAADAHASVEQWQEVFDDSYTDTDAEDAAFNVVGWVSSYTGEAIPDDHMRTWRNTRVEQLLALKPQRVLEIGCGSGLLLSQIAPHCETYEGTDFSQQALEYLANALTKQHMANVTLRCRPADDFSELEHASYNLVILNSVVQYFPNIEYLDSVLQGAVELLRPDGKLFVGDVRDFRLLRAFHTDVQLFRSPANRTANELRQLVRTRLGQEKELLIHPGYFESLSERLQLGRPLLTLQRGPHRNEMSLFRYDVMLPVDGGGPEQSPNVTWLSWPEEGLSLEALREMLSSDQTRLLGLAKVPNARIRDAVQSVCVLGQDDGPDTVSGLRESLNTPTVEAIEPDELQSLATELGYQVRIQPNVDPGAMQVLFAREGRVLDNVAFPPTTDSPLTLDVCANHPLRGSLGSELVGPLRSHLKQRLPEYMVPGAIVFLDELPLTPNGKLDRKALPAPDGGRPELAETYVPPRNATEEAVAAIWQELLGLDRVGVHDNFFELGGHSLMATQAVSRARTTFGLDVPLRVLFEHNTVAAFAAYLESGAELLVELPLVALRGTGSQMPLFLIHPPGGSVGCYVHVVGALSSNRPCYGLQAHGLDGEAEPVSDLATAADAYLEAIAEIHKDGQLNVVGWSGGGYYALEVARRWKMRGGEVGLLGLFDTSAPETDFTADDSIWEEKAPILFANIVSEYLESLGFPIVVNADDLAHMTPENQVEHLLSVYQEAGFPLPEELVVHARRLPLVGKATLEAVRTYEPSYYGGKVTVFRAIDAMGDPEAEGEFRAGWAGMAREVDIVAVPGNHRSMIFLDSNAQVLSARIEELLESAEQDISTPISRPPEA